jgi:hypothetical protein
MKQNIILSFPAFFGLFLCFKGLKNNCSSLFYTSNDIKNVQLGFEMKENLKVFGDRIPFGDKRVYPSCNPIATQIVVI